MSNVVDKAIDLLVCAGMKEYGKEVITDRAIPSIKDGLKPVHRRILYAMHDLGIKDFSKSARVVGEVIGNYHPHGDSSVYNALVLMAAEHEINMPLIDPHGNFGTPFGDGPAAMRYTNCKLAKAADILLRDLSKDTVSWSYNFSDTKYEPDYLPAILPTVLINGQTGIALGYSTSLLPHNPVDVINLLCAYIKNRDIKIGEMVSILNGPDFPSRGVINGAEHFNMIYGGGKGKVRLRGVMEEFTHTKTGAVSLIITELPYKKSTAALAQQIAELADSGAIQCSDVRDESNKNGIRVVVDLKKSEDPVYAKNMIISKTSFESVYDMSMNILDLDGNIKQYNLKSIVEDFVKFREETIIKKLNAEMERHKDRLHIIEGMFIVSKDLDKVIELVRKSEGKEEATKKLMMKFSLSETQANYIVSLRLYNLTKTDMEAMREEKNRLRERVKVITNLTRSKSNKDLDKYMVDEWLELKDKVFSKWKRRTVIQKIAEKQTNHIVKEEDCTIVYSKNGFIKRIAPLNADEMSQNRGGMGVKLGLQPNDEISQIINTTTTSSIVVITSAGRALNLKPYILEEQSKNARGRLARNVLKLNDKEEIVLFCPVKQSEIEDKNNSIVTVSSTGMVKATKLMEVASINAGGKKLVGLDKRTAVIVDAVVCNKNDSLLISTANGNTIRFSASQVKDTGTGSVGVIGIRLMDDSVTSMIKLDDYEKDKNDVVFISENGFIKRVPSSEFKMQHRGGTGLMTNPKSDGYGTLLKTIVYEDKNITVVTKNAKSISFALRDLKATGRTTKGVRSIKLAANDVVVSVSI